MSTLMNTGACRNNRAVYISNNLVYHALFQTHEKEQKKLKNPPPPPRLNTSGPRFPSIKRGHCCWFNECVTLSLADARDLPSSNSPRLRCRFYNASPRLLPNGLPRTTPLVADAILEIGETFLVVARILQEASKQQPKSWLQVERKAHDEATGQLVLMPPYAPGLIRAAYDTMAAQQVILSARRAAQGRRN